MPKDSALVAAYLDYCADHRARGGIVAMLENKPGIEVALAHFDEEWRLWRACLDAGWTLDELDAAFLERFGDDPRVRRVVERRAAERRSNAEGEVNDA